MIITTQTPGQYFTPPGMRIKAPFHQSFAEVLTPEALLFIAALQQNFNARRKQLLNDRQLLQVKLDAGWQPGLLPETESIRNSAWLIASVPDIIKDRRVEITGPVDRKMIINACNSGANIFMADFEDSNAPSWDNTIGGQINLKDAINRNINFYNAENGKEYTLNEKTATLFIRPRGWHLDEKHIELDGEPVSASLVDFGLYFFHNAKTLLKNGAGPFFYLPKLESYKEARLWNDVFTFAQNYCGVAHGSIKATVLVETILASFQLHEILWELRDHSAGLNCGRWDYIFSFIKKFRNVPQHVFPDRAQVTMTVPFMRAYTQLVIKTCHQRGAHAIGGMAAQIPIRGNEKANEAALQKVKADKLREVKDGHDGTWVAHPGLVSLAKEVFDEFMKTPNQLHVKREDFSCTEKELLQVPGGTITEAGLRHNINVGILYLESWLRGNGAAALYNMMEDAATAEICRTQVWQWVRSKAKLDDGREINLNLYIDLRDDEIESIKNAAGSKVYQAGQYVQAICIFNKLVVQDKWEDFLTLPAYDLILSNNEKKVCKNDTPIPSAVIKKEFAEELIEKEIVSIY
ncbi:malate synthase A [Ferruginibacter sp.]|uniref:malate synthase A n=1 Tax=Ferruginibacter sp. TaxID=1940288 RepID=UPI00265A687E|nr:malate synthase A [Ferruginibacter sp.]